MKNVIVIGGSGFIGHALCQRLSQQYAVTSISRHSPAEHRRIAAVDYLISTSTPVLQQPAIREALERADFVFYLAWSSTPSSTALQPQEEAEQNLLPVLQWLQALQELPATPLAFISSGGSIYNTANSETFTEHSALQPLSYYAANKLAAEHFIQAYHAQTNHPAVILRPSNLYGPGQVQKTQFGIIPTLLNCLHEDTTFTLWGDGSAVRDYLYIEDFIDFCAKLLVHHSNLRFDTFNVASGTGTSINQLIDTVNRISGKSLRIERQLQRKFDSQRSVLSCKHAANRFDWQPQTSLEQGLQKTWQWYLSETKTTV